MIDSLPLKHRINNDGLDTIQVVEIFKGIVVTKLDESLVYSVTVDEQLEKTKRITNFILTIQNDVRLYTSNVDSIQKLWETIRQDEDILDFVMDIKNILFFSITSRNVNLLIDELAKTHSNYDSNSVMDEDTNYRLHNEEGLRDLLNANKWVTPLFLLKHVSFTKQVLNLRDIEKTKN
ncbi:MAG: hypothetical protein IBX57_01065 [Gammaproteobacteria bacterium]|nr:hypothetical protein [Gammaproteobacteria bacterium]